MSIALVVGFLLVASTLTCLAFAWRRSWIRVACVLAGVIGVLVIGMEQRRLQHERAAAHDALREQCHSTAGLLRSQARVMRDPQTRALAEKDLLKWHRLDGQALALWPLCVNASCYQPGGYAPDPDVMDKVAEMLDTGVCLPAPPRGRSDMKQ